jgi:uncharacterized protein (TIGR03118 family)
MRKIDSPHITSLSSVFLKCTKEGMLRLSFVLCILAFLVSPARADVFTVTNLVTDDQTVNAAQIADPTLVNAWGISFSSGPFWVSDNGTGKSTLYSVNPVSNATAKLGLEVSIPGDGSVTGQVSNPSAASGAFHGDNFLFVSEDGTVSGWRGALGTTAETLQLATSDNVYKGSAIATVGSSTYLYAANFRTGRIDVIKGNSGAPDLSGSFQDPTIPAGYAPFNIQNIGGKLYVTYALQDADKHDEVAGPGNGFVSVFDAQGNFLGRVGSQGTLDAPWGLALAPASFGTLAGDLLVGNFGDGRINVFDPTGTDAFIEQLAGTDGDPLAIDGLWGLTPGNGGGGGSTQLIYFSAGPGDESHGLFGVISSTSAPPVPSVPEPPILLLVGAAIVGIGLTRKRKVNG